MRIARKLMLLALTAIAAMALAASSASALEQVEVEDEDQTPFVHCPALTATGGGCLVHADGVATLRVDLGIFGEAHEATCNLEIVFRVDEVGNSKIDQVIESPGEANCTEDSSSVVVECNLPWSASGEEDGATGIVQSNATVCLNPAESSTDCTGNLAFNIVNQAGHYETQFNNATVGLCELDADLEIEHTDPKYEDIHVKHAS